MGSLEGYLWLDHVSAAVGQPCPPDDEAGLDRLLHDAFEQKVDCLLTPLPLCRAPALDNFTDIDACLLRTFGLPPWNRPSRLSAGDVRVDCLASEMGEMMRESFMDNPCQVANGMNDDHLWPMRLGHESNEGAC